MPITIRKFRVGSADIEDNAIGSSAMIDADVVMGYHIVDDAIGSEHLANDAVSYAAQVKDGILGYAELTGGLQGSIDAGSVPPADSIGTTELKDDSVGSQHIRDGAIAYGTQIKADVIGSEHLEANAVGSSVQVADDTIGSAQIIDNTVGYSELTTGLQGSFAGVPERPYAGDDSEISITGTTPGTVKTATVLKDTYACPIGSIKIAAQLKASAGSYNMQVLLGTVHKFSFSGTETVYKIRTGSMGVGGESDGALALEFTLKNSQGAGISYNKLLDIITVM